jgi:hypothetical protein
VETIGDIQIILMNLICFTNMVENMPYYCKKSRDKNGKILDIGADAGSILEGFVDEGWDGIGIEPNKAVVD